MGNKDEHNVAEASKESYREKMTMTMEIENKIKRFVPLTEGNLRLRS